MKRRESLGVDLTPIIDVVFILLIFFIVTSVFKKDELALILNLPDSNAKSLEVDKKEISIELNPKDVALGGRKLSFSNLDLELSTVTDKKKSIIVRIDKEVKYQRVVKLLDILQKHNLTNLALVTEEK